jgi:hypothetical protein
MDTITVDIPLLIRLLEYAKEDAQTDMDLHKVAEKCLKHKKRILSMNDYAKLIPRKRTMKKKL